MSSRRLARLRLTSLFLASLCVVSIFLAGCRSARSSSGPTAPLPGGPANQLAELPPGPATAVVRLTPDLPTAVLAGPFEVFTVNPGGSLAMALASGPRCDDASLAWFSYSGGGVAVGSGQVLCVRSHAASAVTHGFSGSSPARPATP